MGGFKDGSVDGWDDDDDEVGAEASGMNDALETASAETSHTDIEASTQDSTWGTDTDSPPRLPWIHRRSSITDGRENTVQLHLQTSTSETERTQKSEIEAILGDSVKKADLREAALLVGLEHTNEVADQLREWGYAITD
jgi:hypothetical protein